MDQKLIGMIALAVIAVFGLIAKLAMKKPSKLALADGETRLAEMWVETRDITFGGLVLVGNALTGKLVLTTRRLLYANVNEQKVALELAPAQVSAVDTGTKGIVSKRPTLVLGYTNKKGKSKRATFVQVASVGGPGIGQTFEAGAQTPLADFVERLSKWRNAA
jgi:hypothetical protein